MGISHLISAIFRRYNQTQRIDHLGVGFYFWEMSFVLFGLSQLFQALSYDDESVCRCG